MKTSVKHPLEQQIHSTKSIRFISVLFGLSVLLASILLQWLVYDDWLHRTGPLRLIGSILAAALTCAFTFRWRTAVREQQLEMVRRFQTIARMNDQIRNALQTIECATFAASPGAMDPVLDSVAKIEAVLGEVLADTHPAFSVKSDMGAWTQVLNESVR